MTTISDRVTAGAEFLDERDPEWWREDVPDAIDLDTLALRNTRLCVLGQRCPLEVLAEYSRRFSSQPYAGNRYYAYARALSPEQTAMSIDRWAQEHGFSDDENASEDAWSDLTSAWWVLINERRKLAADEAVTA